MKKTLLIILYTGLTSGFATTCDEAIEKLITDVAYATRNSLDSISDQLKVYGREHHLISQGKLVLVLNEKRPDQWHGVRNGSVLLKQFCQTKNTTPIK